MKAKTRKYCGVLFVKKISNLTSNIYFWSLSEIMAQLQINSDFYSDFEYRVRVANSGSYPLDEKCNYTTETVLQARELTDDLYLNKLLELPSNIIEDILFVHNKGKLVRAQRTVNALIYELVRRSLLEDSSELKPKPRSKNGKRHRRLRYI
jgi:hypothetical protein